MYAIIINLVFYNLPKTLPLLYRLIPQFAFSRCIFYLATLCSKGRCITSIANSDDEFVDCLISLVVSGIFFIIFAVYLNEVVPSEYSATKHPLFCLKKCFKNRR